MIRLLCVGALILLAAAIGCGSDSPVTPADNLVVRIVSGDAQEVALRQTEPAPLVVLVTTPFGEPVSGVRVNWAVVSGGGKLSASNSITDQSGQASVTWTLGESGPQSVKASPGGTQEVSFSARAVVQLMSIASGDAQKGLFGVTLAPIVVLVTDASLQPAPNVKVNWGVVAGGGSLSSASSLTAQNGKATVSWTLGPQPNVNQSVKASRHRAGKRCAIQA
ncbi:MAG: Ig-like domain-containing protein [Gemmatimonadaceae bacterium]